MAMSQEEKLEKAYTKLQDFDDLVQTFKQSSEEFKETSKVSEKTNLPRAEVEPLEAAVEEFQHTLKQFALDIKEFQMNNTAVLGAVGLPPDVRKSWLESVNLSGNLRREAGEALEKARAACTSARAAVKKELLKAAKARLQQEDPGEMAVARARNLVELCESKVEPFIGIPKNKEEGEMQWIATELDPMIAAAEEAIEAALAQTKEHPLKMEVDNIEDEIKEDIKDYLKDEAKRLQMSLGQLKKRTRRVRNLVANYQKDVQMEKGKELIDELKPQLLEQVKALDLDTLYTEVATGLQEAEKMAEKVKMTMPLEELQAIAKEMDAKVAEAANSLEFFSQQVCPVEEHAADADDYVKETLRKYIEKEVKGVQRKTQQLKQRHQRLQALMKRYDEQIKRQAGVRVRTVRTKALKMMDAFREDQADKGLEGLPSQDIFKMVDKDEDGVISQEEFLLFFEEISMLLEEKQQKLAPSTEELEQLFNFGQDGEGLSLEAFQKLLIRWVQVLRPTSITRSLTIAPDEVVRDLKHKEVLEVLAGPQISNAKLKRAFCRAKDGAVGWVTVVGNGGTAFLQEVQEMG